MAANDLNHVKMVLWGETSEIAEAPIDEVYVRQRLWMLPEWIILQRTEHIGDVLYLFVEFSWWRALRHLAFWRYLADALVRRLMKR